MLHRPGCKEINKTVTRIECFIVTNKISSLIVRQRQTSRSLSENSESTAKSRESA